MAGVYSLPIRANRPSTRNAINARSTSKEQSKKRTTILNPYKKPCAKKKTKTMSKGKNKSPTASLLNAASDATELDSNSMVFPKHKEDDEEAEFFENLLLDTHLDETGLMRDMEYDILAETTNSLFEDETSSKLGLSLRSSKMYDRYQNLFKDFCKVNRIPVNKRYDDQMLVKFFASLKNTYSPSTIWVIYSCVNRLFIAQEGKKLNDLPRLRIFLKNLSSRYVAKKSKVFSPEQIHTVLMNCMESKDPFDTIMGVGISVMYFGLLRARDVMNIQCQDVTCNEERKYEVNFEHMRKRKNVGFTYTIPIFYSPLFAKYITQIDESKMTSNRFLKNFNKRSGSRIQNCGINNIRKWIKKMCDMLHIDADGYTTHCFRRSAATNLADAGVSFINLKRHGQWQSDAVVEGYIANSKPMRLEREVNLVPENLRETAQFCVGMSSKKSGAALPANASQYKILNGSSNKMQDSMNPKDVPTASNTGGDTSGDETVTYLSFDTPTSHKTVSEDEDHFEEGGTYETIVISSQQELPPKQPDTSLSQNNGNPMFSQIVIREEQVNGRKPTNCTPKKTTNRTRRPMVPHRLPQPFVTAAQHARNAAVGPALVSPLDKLLGRSSKSSEGGHTTATFHNCTFNFS